MHSKLVLISGTSCSGEWGMSRANDSRARACCGASDTGSNMCRQGRRQCGGWGSGQRHRGRQFVRGDSRLLQGYDRRALKASGDEGDELLRALRHETRKRLQRTRMLQVGGGRGLKEDVQGWRQCGRSGHMRRGTQFFEVRSCQLPTLPPIHPPTRSGCMMSIWPPHHHHCHQCPPSPPHPTHTLTSATMTGSG
jgi:hypothetical protein